MTLATRGAILPSAPGWMGLGATQRRIRTAERLPGFSNRPRLVALAGMAGVSSSGENLVELISKTRRSAPWALPPYLTDCSVPNVR